MRRALALVALSSASLLGASLAAESALAATPCTAPAKYSRVDRKPYIVSPADAYRLSCQVARAFGPKNVASDLGIRSANRLVICVEFARVNYVPVFRSASTAGCLRGFALRR